MSLIKVTNLTFSYESNYDNIFDNVNFQIDTDWKLGFVGRNGRGKTTFLNLLMGKYDYSGSITASVKFEYFPYEVEDKSADTLEVIHRICYDTMDWEIIRELSLLEVSEEVLMRPFRTLSNGEQTKVLLAALFLISNSFLLIDEPTNHLDVKARESVRNYLNKKKGFILVSHDRTLLDGCVDHILSINKTNIEIQKGNFSIWQENKTMQDNFELAENEKLKGEVKRLTKAAKRGERWSNEVEKTKYQSASANPPINKGFVDKGYIGHKSAKAMKRAKNIEARQQKAITDKSKLLHNIEVTEDLMMQPLTYHSKVLLEMSEVSIYYGDKKVCEDINMLVSNQDRVAIVGKNGSGKSSILKLIIGEDIAYTGTLRLGSGLIISYVSQDTSKLQGDLSEFAYKNGIDETIFKTNLRKLDFSRGQFDKRIEHMSEGQKKKILLAKSLSEKAHLYIWDEPLNYIDVFSRIQIEELILRYCPTLIFVEHDDTFMEKIKTKSLLLTIHMNESRLQS